MVLRIERDYSRFREIVRGKIKQELKKFIIQGELIARQGKTIVSIPIQKIEIPHFKFDYRQMGGVGQGEGEAGDGLGPAEKIASGGKAGSEPAPHILEVEVSLEELAQILGEELELPRIQPKGKFNIESVKEKYTGISKSGPESLRHFKRTFKEALKRQLMSGSYNYDNPVIIPIRDDKRYRSWKIEPIPVSTAAIIYMMDISGSMGEEQKEIVRLEAFWIDTWIRSQYNKVDIRYIVHDAEAYEVDRETFYHIREGGGTKISSAYRLCQKLINKYYPVEEWNIYLFHFSDGDNWDIGDTDTCINILKNDLLNSANLFCYGQVKSAYGSGDFLYQLERKLTNKDNLITSKINSKDDIWASIKKFLQKGK